MAFLKAINISKQRETIKTPVSSGKFCVNYGIEGDAHAGNWHRQVSLLAQESIDKMIVLGGEGLDSGKFAENIIAQGISLHTLPVGTHVLIGPCLVEVTQIGKKCHQHCEIFKKIGTCIMPQEGIFVKVLSEGQVCPGDIIQVLNGDEQVNFVLES